MKTPRSSKGCALTLGNGTGIYTSLSPRQLQVAELAACGYSNREIASELETTEQIVKNVLHSVFDRVGVWNRVELANRFPRALQLARAELNFSRQPQPEPIESSVSCSKFVEASESGMELRDLLADAEFPLRKRRFRQESCTADAYRTVARVFAENPDVIVQHLVDAATTFCAADSAGISLEDGEDEGERKFRWIAISGTFASFIGGTTPRFFSPCGTTLDRGRAQLYRVSKPYYDYLGIKAEPITDGILIPWQAGEVRGTIWVVSHQYQEAFDMEDFKLIEGLADFTAIAVENRFRRKRSPRGRKDLIHEQPQARAS